MKIPQCDVGLTDSSNLCLPLPSVDSTSTVRVSTGSPSMSSACEDNCKDDGSVYTEEVNESQSVVDFADDGISDNRLEIGTLDNIEESEEKSTSYRDPIRPLYKYMKDNKCQLCGFESQSKDICNARKHLFVHITDKSYKCDVCDKRFSNVYYMYRHRFVHSDVFPFACDMCDKKFRDSFSIYNHKRSVHQKRKWRCEICNKEVNSKKSLNRHLRLHTGERPHVCPICEEAFHVKGVLTTHLRQKHGSHQPHQCSNRSSGDLCDQKSLENPRTLEDKKTSHERKQDWKCEVCDKSLSSKKSLRVHSKIHTGEWSHVCQICKLSFPSNNGLSKHLRRYHFPHQCSQCSMSLASKFDLDNHECASDENLTQNTAGNRDTTISSVTLSSGSLVPTLVSPPSTSSSCGNNHSVNAGGSTLGCECGVNSGEDRNPENILEIGVFNSLKENDKRCAPYAKLKNANYKKKIFNCDICDEMFSKKKYMLSHRVQHPKSLLEQKRKWKCDICKKDLCSRQSLQRHFKTHIQELLEDSSEIGMFDSLAEISKNSSIDTFLIGLLHKYIKGKTCLLCGFESKANDLNDAKEHLLVHITNKNKCDICDKKFSSETNMLRHRVAHSVVLPIPCDVCGKKFRDKHGLYSHKRTVHNSKCKRKWKCEVCNKDFAKLVGLKEHLTIHTGERPHVCPVCKEAFRVKGLMTKHLRKQHASDRCPLCNLTFASTSDLQNHGCTSHESLTQNSVDSRDQASSSVISSKLQSSADHVDSSEPCLSLSPACLVPAVASPTPSAGENVRCSTKLSSQEWDEPASNVDSTGEQKSENGLEKSTLGKSGEGSTPYTKLLRPLYKYMKNKKCLLCGFKFQAQDASIARQHLLVHVTNKDFKCDVCGKGFATEQYMLKHRVVHSDVFPFVCNLCDKKYRFRNSLYLHKRSVHQQKRWKCEVCNKDFTSKVHLKEHLSNHTAERPHVCPICKVGFRKEYNFLIHIRRLHGSNAPYPYKCECGRKFVYQSSFEQHKLVGKCLHACSVCGLKFKQAHQLKSHFLIHQPTVTTNQEHPEKAAESESRVTDPPLESLPNTD